MPAADDQPVPIRAARVDLVPISAAVMALLLAGEHADAERLLDAAIPVGWPDELDRSLLDMRLVALRADPQAAPWLLRAVVRREPDSLVVGHAGFHGPPGTNALGRQRAVELGYDVFPDHRRQGFGHEIVAALICWASAVHSVRCFIASIAPGNEASVRTVRPFGFRPVGTRWDDEDGLEVVFRLDLPTPRA